jgi:phage host-nuclease inhibitor protein Gam
MAKRVSKNVVTGITEEQYQEALAKYATDDAKVNQIVAEMDVEISKLRERYDGRLSKLQTAMTEHYEVIETYASENKDQLFDKKRSIETLYGTIGFRTGTPKLKLLPRKTWEIVLDNLRSYLPDYVRTTEEPAKDRLINDREMEAVALALPKVGLQVVQDEKFFIELKKEEAAV